MPSTPIRSEWLTPGARYWVLVMLMSMCRRLRVLVGGVLRVLGLLLLLVSPSKSAISFSQSRKSSISGEPRLFCRSVSIMMFSRLPL